MKKDYFKETLEKMQDIKTKKNTDYGNSFSKSIDKYGFISAFVRIEDKIERITNLLNSDTVLVEDEKIDDTLLDGANYMVLTLEEYKKRKDKNKPIHFINPDLIKTNG